MYHSGVIYSIASVLLFSNLTLVFPSYKLNPIDALESIHKYKCNHLIAMPKILGNILDENRKRNIDISSLIVAIAGGQTVTGELIQRVKKETKCWIFSSGYGMTEIGGLTINKFFLLTFIPSWYNGCVGQPAPFTECKIIDPETGQIQPINTEGELHVRGYSITRGYWNDTEMTSKLIDSERWYFIFFCLCCFMK